MDMTGAHSSPVPSTDVWQLQSNRRHDCVHRDAPSKNGELTDIASTLPEEIINKLRDVNIRSIDPLELGQLAGMLHREGYISHDAWEQLCEFQLDFKGPFDPLAKSMATLEWLCGKGRADYALSIKSYTEAVDAMQGVEALIDYLSGQVLEAYA